MIDVLRFWRDVEIFNIPDAPTPKKIGQSEDAPSADNTESDFFHDSDGPGIDAHNISNSGASSHPKSRVIQHFPARADLAKDRKAPFPPLLPWHDPRFKVTNTAQATPSKPKAAESESRNDGSPSPASYAHAVYLGVGPKQRFVDFILRTHAIPQTDDEIYRPATGLGWLAALLVGEDGVPMPKNYVAASFAVGSRLLLENRPLDMVRGELQERTAGFDKRMEERSLLTWEDLIDEWKYVHQQLGSTDDFDDEGPLGPFIVVESVPLYRRKDGSLNPPPEQAATFLNSFFIDDLTALIQDGPTVFSSALTQYLGPDSPTPKRLDLLSDPKALADQVSPELLPLGRWAAPPNEHLSLAQQAAVYQILHGIGQADGNRSCGLMAVNGPPGTGKTTLLKDVIAEVVVQRAIRISALGDPKKLFSDREVQVSDGDKTTSVPALRAGIVDGTEIVVTSSNNAAVQNISFELPFSCDRNTFPDASYLPEVAAFVGEQFELQRKNPWGLLSGALGAKSNREKIATALMGYEKAVDLDKPGTHPAPNRPSSLKPWLDLARQQSSADNGIAWSLRWKEAKEDFDNRLANVKAMRAKLADLDKAMRELPGIPAQRNALQTQLNKQRSEEQSLRVAEATRLAKRTTADGKDQAVSQALASQRVTQDFLYKNRMDNLEEVRKLYDPGMLAHCLKKVLGMETQGYKDWKDEITKARAPLEAAEAELKAIDDELKRIARQMAARADQADQALREYEDKAQSVNAKIADLEHKLKKLDELEGRHQERIQAMRIDPDFSAGDPYLPDEAFLSLPTEERHRRSLWVSTRLDQARSELFLSALRLHQATLMANADNWFKVLRVVRNVLSGQAQPKTNEDLATVWRSLFFVVPVVSTTLASFGRLFQRMGRESLGWVLVDEAGQATPASVAGALWRARRAVIVGDPLQIEPVVTAPRKLVESLGQKRGMDDPAVTRWSPSVQSAQTLSDRTMRLGAMVGDVWTGLPLRTHRRCMNPMFEIANRIAYKDQMVQATGTKGVEPDLFASCWIDVRGKASGKVVGDEIDALSSILESFLLEWPQVVDSKGKKEQASVYVISPFRDVALACKKQMGADSSLGRKFARKKLVVDAGTVHTFQGKEASIVFLVLGSSPGNAGESSRRWAASKPNLLNVAVTRAQQRFYVIGNYADWTGLRFFSELSENAKRLPRTRIEDAQGTGRVRLVPASEAATMTE